MNAQALIETARALLAGDKGLLAMDESKRFAKAGIPEIEEARHAYRECTKDGTPFVKVLADAA